METKSLSVPAGTDLKGYLCVVHRPASCMYRVDPAFGPHCQLPELHWSGYRNISGEGGDGLRNQNQDAFGQANNWIIGVVHYNVKNLGIIGVVHYNAKNVD